MVRIFGHCTRLFVRYQTSSVMVHVYCLLLFISIWDAVTSEVSVISIESTKSYTECHEISIETGIFGWFRSEYQCSEQVSPTALKKLFVEKFGICPCHKPHEWVARLARDNKIDWESFKSEILEIPNEFPDYHGFLLVEEIVPRCSDNGELNFHSGGDSIYQLNTVHGIVSSANCTFINEYGRCWAKHPMLFFRGNTSRFSTHAPSPSKRTEVGSGYALMWSVLSMVIVLLIGVALAVFCRRTNNQKHVPREKGKDFVTFDI